MDGTCMRWAGLASRHISQEPSSGLQCSETTADGMDSLSGCITPVCALCCGDRLVPDIHLK